MKIKKYFIFFMLFLAININARGYKNITTIHPIANECNKNAKKIEALMKHYNIRPMQFHKPDIFIHPKEQAEYQLIIISSIVILENFNQGNIIPAGQIIKASRS